MQTKTWKDRLKMARKTAIGLPGEKYGRLTIESEAEPTNSGVRRIVARCDCGKIRIVSPYRLADGTIYCCVDCKAEEDWQKTREKTSSMIGQKYGHLTVLYVNKEHNQYGEITLHCLCDCGNEVDVSKQDLKSGNNKSCGHLAIDREKRKSNRYDLSGDYGIGYVDSGEAFYFDLEDYDLIKQYYWNIFWSHGYPYIVTRKCIDGKYKVILLHRLVMNVLDNPDVEVDHIKHNTADNRKSQLRLGTKGENNCNHDIFVNNTSGNTGVTWDKKVNKWAATISRNKNHYWLGYYENYDDAVTARKEAEDKYFKEWSFDNSMNAELPEEIIQI